MPSNFSLPFLDPMPLFWAAATVGIYALARFAHLKLHRWWTSPLLVTWIASLGLAFALHANYGDYVKGTHWLSLLLGPATVAFAVPIYRERAILRRQWRVLAIGVGAGVVIAAGSSWLLANLLGLSPELRLSLLPRSVSMPFAVVVSDDVGGIPGITATCVILTGLFGAAIGDALLNWLPLRSAVARGALYGMGAHGCGVAKARECGTEEGSVAGLVMVLAGMASVASAPLVMFLVG